MAGLDFSAAIEEYIGWLQLEANRSFNTVRAYRGELAKLTEFLRSQGHSLLLAELDRSDLRAYQRYLAEHLKGAASRQRALVAVRSWLRWLAREELISEDLSGRITLPKVEQRLPKPLPADELSRLLANLPTETELQQRDRALVYFLISTGCRISEALALDRAAVPSQGNRVVVTGKGAKQRVVYLTQDAGLALKCYLDLRSDTSPALFINYDRSESKAGHRRLTTDGARHVVRRLRSQLGVWSFASPHVARHTAATSLLEVSGGDVRLVQEVLGHATLGTMQGYTKIVDARKQEAYRGYQTYLEEKKEEGGRAEG